jgi:tRNA threonylcarbamoyladenosine biosynthesis protein TsaB
MNILAFDTCLGACSAAVLLDEQAGEPRNRAWRHERMATGHAERLMPMIEEVLREAGRTVGSLDAIAVTEGPGTFTGIRVGVAAARGFALATGLPIRATTCLHVMAHQAIAELGEFGERKLVVCMEGRAGQAWVQTFDGRSGDAVSEPGLMAPAEAAADMPDDVVCIGSAGAALAAVLQESGGRAEALLPDLQPDARMLALLAPTLEVRKPLLPLYLRAPDAKPQIGKSLPRA